MQILDILVPTMHDPSVQRLICDFASFLLEAVGHAGPLQLSGQLLEIAELPG